MIWAGVKRRMVVASRSCPSLMPADAHAVAPGFTSTLCCVPLAMLPAAARAAIDEAALVRASGSSHKDFRPRQAPARSLALACKSLAHIAGSALQSPVPIGTLTHAVQFKRVYPHSSGLRHASSFPPVRTKPYSLGWQPRGDSRQGGTTVRYQIRVKPLNRVFRTASEIDARVARVAVLYEDLRLENLAASEESIPKLDASGTDLRRFYFIRRSIGTVREFAEALEMLHQHAHFDEVKSRFDADARRMWDKSVRFFQRRDKDLRDIRNDFGGHFGYRPAWFAINHLHDGPVIFEYAADRGRQRGNVRFKFAGEIVAIGMRRHARADNPVDHFRLMFRLALAGFGHAARCAQILAVYDLWPRFRGR